MNPDGRKWILWSEACRAAMQYFKHGYGDVFRGRYLALTLEYLRLHGEYRLVHFDPDAAKAQLAWSAVRYSWWIRNPELGPRYAEMPMIHVEKFEIWLLGRIPCEVCGKEDCRYWPAADAHCCRDCVSTFERSTDPDKAQYQLAVAQLRKLAETAWPLVKATMRRRGSLLSQYTDMIKGIR